jgi:hypothetical protein
MFRTFMLALWVFSGYFLGKSYFRGLAEFNSYQKASTKAFHDTALGGPWAGFKDMGDMMMWYQIAAVVTLVIFVIFSKEVWQAHGPKK